MSKKQAQPDNVVHLADRRRSKSKSKSKPKARATGPLPQLSHVAALVAGAVEMSERIIDACPGNTRARESGRLLAHVAAILGAGAEAGEVPEMLERAANALALALLIRKTPRGVSDRRRDLARRCDRAAADLVRGATALLSGNVTPGDEDELRGRLEGAEQRTKGVRSSFITRRAKFLEAVAHASWFATMLRADGEHYDVPVQLRRYVNAFDAEAARLIADKDANDCVAAWRISQGEHGDKWQTLANACATLRIGDVQKKTLEREWRNAKQAGIARDPADAT